MPPTDTTPLIDASEEVVATESAAGLIVTDNVVQNWEWVLVFGILNVVGGLCCLIAPVWATFVAEAIISWALIVVGTTNGLSACVAEVRPKQYYLCLGIVQLVIGLVMLIHPFKTLSVLTILLSVLILLDGLFRVIIVFRIGSSERGWILVLFGGLASVIIGVIGLLSMPEASLYVIGIILGVNLITVGNVRIHLAWEGRCIANQ